MRVGSFRLSVYSLFIVVFVAVWTVPVLARVLKADLNCDGQVDLDDYSLAVRGGSVDYGLLQSEFGSKDGDCKKTTSSTSNGSGSNNPTPTPSPSLSPSPSPSASPSGAINLQDANLVAYFNMDETAGPLKSLKTGTSADLIQMGSVTYGQTGKVGKAVKLGGNYSGFCTGTGVSCADNKAYTFSGGFTFGMWIKLDSITGNQRLFRKWGNTGEGSYSFGLYDGKYVGSLAHPWPDWLGAYDIGPYKATLKGRSWRHTDNAVVGASNWHHVVIVRDTTVPTYEMYVDGKPVGSKVGVTTQASNGAQVTSVMRPDNQLSLDFLVLGEFNGLLDEVFVYKKALTAAEVQTIYKSY